MKIRKIKSGTVIVIIYLFTSVNCLAQTKQQSQWVYPGTDGKLKYKTTASGDQIMDFSHAGYMGGGVSLPSVPVKRIVNPSGSHDDLIAIQSAINEVAAMPLVNGFRGTVLLSPGKFNCSGSIIISADGIVLRGSGENKNGTVIWITGNPHTAIVIGLGNTKIPLGATEKNEISEPGPKTYVTDSYVPCGTNTITLANTTGFAVGDTIIIKRPVTPAWIHFMQMDDMFRNGKKEVWIAPGRTGIINRRITALIGQRITLDIPVPDSYDARYLGSAQTTVSKVKLSVRLKNIGIEAIHIQCSPLEVDYGHAPYAAIRIGGDDCWVKNVFCEETMNSTVLAGDRITMEHVVVKHTYTNLGASKPTDFSLEGSQNLIDRCEISGGNTYFVWTSGLIYGPNVLLNCTFTGLGSRIQPHQRWATALLLDNCSVPDGGIDFMNRGVAGSGHGWTMGWAVAWNCIAKTYIIQNPPGAFNWAIGCIGERQQTARLFDTGPIQPEGIFDSYNKPVSVQSLYLAQLSDRLGSKALKNIGYPSNTLDQFPNKRVKPETEHLVIDKVLGRDLAYHRPVNTTNARNEISHSGEKALDDNSHTYWAVKDNVLPASFEVDMEGPVDVDALQISETENLHHVQEYKVEAQVNSDWILLSSGTDIGENKVIKFPKVTVWKVKLTILKTSDAPAISHFGLYCLNGKKAIK
jgi:hypothetical protein